MFQIFLSDKLLTLNVLMMLALLSFTRASDIKNLGVDYLFTQLLFSIWQKIVREGKGPNPIWNSLISQEMICFVQVSLWMGQALVMASTDRETFKAPSWSTSKTQVIMASSEDIIEKGDCSQASPFQTFYGKIYHKTWFQFSLRNSQQATLKRRV